MSVHQEGTSSQLGQSSASIAPGIQRAYSSSLHQFLIRDRVVQTDEDIDIAQVQGQIAPIPLAGQGHPQQKGSFVQQEQSGDSD